jgi:hypothetical protein
VRWCWRRRRHQATLLAERLLFGVTTCIRGYAVVTCCVHAKVRPPASASAPATVWVWLHQSMTADWLSSKHHARTGQLLMDSQNQVATVIAMVLTGPQLLSPPCTSWTLDRLTA